MAKPFLIRWLKLRSELGQRSAAVQNPVAGLEIKFSLFPGGGHHHGGQQIVTVGIQHAAGIGRQLHRPEAALPGGLDPDGGLAAEHIRPPGQQHVGVVGIGGQGQHGPQVIDGPGSLAPQHLAAQPALAPEIDLLLHQPALGIHIVGKAHVQEAAVLLPQLFMAALFQLVLKSHGPDPPQLFFRQLLLRRRPGSRKGVAA